MNVSALEDKTQLSKELPTYSQLNQIRQLEPKELATMLPATRDASPTDSLVLIDVRDPLEFKDLAPLPNIISIPLHLLPSRIPELEREYKDKKIVVVCRAGVRSATACSLLNGLGFPDVWNLKGGMLSWEKAGLPR
jgi:rhodanese-related sulfurtransferase